MASPELPESITPGVTTGHVTDHEKIHDLLNEFDSAAQAQATGDLLVFQDGLIKRLPVGSDGQVLTADSGETAGVKWATPTGGGGGGGAGRTLLGQVTLESPQSAIEFTDLNQGFSDLLIVCRLRSDRTSNTGDDVELVLGDESYDTGGSSYRYRETGDGSATTTGGAASIRMNRIAAANADPGAFGLLRITIFDYSLAGERLIETKSGGYWTSGTSTGTGTSSATAVRQGIGVWRNTSDPVSRLRLTPGNGSNFVAGSSVRVYGLS